MAVSYKGLVIKFGGDTTELQGALKKVQKASRDTQSDLRDINKALKFNPGNTELLAQKVKTLNAAYEETEQRLDAYKQALQTLEEKKQSGAKLTEEEERQYDTLKRSIIECESQLDSYDEKIKATGTELEASQTKLYQLGQSIKDNADKWEEHGKRVETVGKTVMGASTAVASGAIAAFNEVDAGADVVIQKTGATGEAADKLNQSFENVAKQSSASMEEIGNAVGEVSTRFGLTGEQLETTSLQFLRFSENTGVDVTATCEDASMAMQAFGVDSSQAGSVLGMFQTVSQQTGIDVQTLMSDVNANGATFRDMGLSIQDSAALLGSFEAAGVPADQMLTGLKKASANCAKSGQDLGTTLQDLTKRLQDPATQAQATQDAIDLFGSKAAMSFVDAAESGRVNLGALGGSLDDYATAVDDTFEGTEDAPDKMKESLHALQISGAELGADILDTLLPAVQKAADIANQLKGVWDGLSPAQQQLAADVVLGGIAFGGLATGIGKAMQMADNIGTTFQNVAKFGTTLTGAAGKVKGAFSGLTSVLMANPWVLVVAGIAAVVAGLVWFFTQTETGRQLWAQFTGWISEKWQAVQDFFAGVPAFWKGIWDNVTGVVTGFVDDVGEKWDALKQGASDTWNGIKDGASTAWNGIKDTVGNIAQGAVNAVSTWWGNLQTNTQTAFSAIGQTVQGDMSTAQTVASSAAGALQAAMSGDWSTALSEAQNAFGAIRDNIQGKMDAARQAAINVADRIGEKLGFPGLGSKVAGVFDSVRNAITSKIQAAWDFVSGIPGRISSAFSNMRIQLPHINLPHFKIDGSFSLDPPSVPHLAVDWYARGGYFDSASIIGVGERGGEYVAPEKQLWSFIERAVNRAFDNQSGQQVNVAVEVNATVAGSMDAYQTGQQIGLGIASKLKQRGVSVAT
ncbi:phage tail tape measure protein [Olsenella sp. Marseille-P4559]|uniref:phage tail tape measure protein n=1 Tax=Olsenella sp. Marseille-P4559 TaxID=2364795 RepID=UPI0010324035|nr:phage tail tape measure protein [Olsenella sp. Marseille-P4559]